MLLPLLMNLGMFGARPSAGSGKGKPRKEKKWTEEEILAYVDAVASTFRKEELPDVVAEAPRVVSNESKIKELLERASELREEESSRSAERRLALLASVANRLEERIEARNKAIEIAERRRLEAEEDEAITVILLTT